MTHPRLAPQSGLAQEQKEFRADRPSKRSALNFPTFHQAFIMSVCAGISEASASQVEKLSGESVSSVEAKPRAATELQTDLNLAIN